MSKAENDGVRPENKLSQMILLLFLAGEETLIQKCCCIFKLFSSTNRIVLWSANVFEKAVIFIMQADDLKTKHLNIHLKKKKMAKKVEVWGLYLNNTFFKT